MSHHQTVWIPIKRLPNGEDLPYPEYATEGAAGMDLRAAIAQPLTIVPGHWRMISTGIAVAVPRGYEAQIRPRSGLALKHGVTVLNSPGTVDSDYRGPVCVILINHGTEPFTVNRGDRIAQMVISPVVKAAWKDVDVLPETPRGNGGFGHTGTS